MSQVTEDIKFLRTLLSELMEQQSSYSLTDKQKRVCKTGIRAVQNAIDALEITVYA